jgi:SAM-dependent methyltransferase
MVVSLVRSARNTIVRPHTDARIEMLCDAILSVSRDSNKDNLVVLDFGCGTDSPVKDLKSHLKSGPVRIRWIGADIHPRAIEASRSKGIHDDYVQAGYPDLGSLPDADVILMLDVIEHLTKDAGTRLLSALEQKARLVIVYTPHKFLYQTATTDNPFQKHHSGWELNDFRSLGYEVSGSAGWLFIHQTFRDPEFDQTVWHWDLKRPQILYRALRHLLSWLPPSVLIRHPQWASFLLATKTVA